MVQRVRNRIARRRPTLARVTVAASALAALLATAALLGCGSTLKPAADARADEGATPASCAATVLEALGHIAARIYHEGVSSERTITALRLIESSTPLRSAVEAGDAKAAQAAGRALLATGHLTNLRVVSAGKTLIDLGGAAVTPLTGTLTSAGAGAGAGGKPIASFTTSVWADSGVIAETNGVAEGTTVLRSQGADGRTIAGAFALPTGALATQGTLTHGGTTYQFTSNEVNAYPDGRPLREYVLRPIASVTPLCGASAEETTVNTVSHIARLIYEGEAGGRTLAQLRRVQSSQALLQAVARREPQAARQAIIALLNQHIVRIRVDAGGRLLSDVGGPYVLAPVSAPLRLGGKTVGSATLSIQDDEGYKRLAARLAGLDVLMYMGPKLVKSTIGFSPGPVPTSGRFSYRGRDYRAYTFDGRAFPSGPLRIIVLIPIPYT